MALIAIHRRRYSGHPSGALPRPYKSHPEDPRSTPHLTALLPSPLPCRNASPSSFSNRHHDARPPHHRSRPSEPPTTLPAPHSPSPAPWPVLVDTGAAGGQSSDEPGAAVHGRSTMDRDSGGPWPRGPSLQEILYENNSLNQYFWEFCKEVPVFVCN
jgi:hypothetical protein